MWSADTPLSMRVTQALHDDNGHEFRTACCRAGTEYDTFLTTFVRTKDRGEFMQGVDAKTALLVIDIQKDLTLGSFGQPCFDSSLIFRTATLIKEFSKKGALIIASKVFQPKDHCGFSGNANICRNLQDHKGHEFTVEQRYQSEVPDHCTYEERGFRNVPQGAPETAFCRSFGDVHSESYSGPPWCLDETFVGTDFDDEIRIVLASLKSDQVEVVFKGFSAHYQSFSAFPSQMPPDTEEKIAEMESTGGFALPKNRAAECHGHWDKPDGECYPRTHEMDSDARGGDDNMRSTIDIMKARGIEHVVVVGLTFDYSVGDTAIFATQAAAVNVLPGLRVEVLADLARPSFDGKPGAPYASQRCDAGRAKGNLCTVGGGTLPAYKAWLYDLEGNGVDVWRLADSTCFEENFDEKAAGFSPMVAFFMMLGALAAFALFFYLGRTEPTAAEIRRRSAMQRRASAKSAASRKSVVQMQTFSR